MCRLQYKINLTQILKSFVVLIIVLNFILGFLLIKNRKFDEDEFEHTHIAWCIKKLNLSIYKDFFEHHGPIYPGFNTFIWNIFEPKSNENVLFLLRYCNFFLSLIICFLVYLIINSILGKSFGFISVLILSCNTFFQKAVCEIRTDNLLHCFLLISIYLLLKIFKLHRQLVLICIGILCGLALFTMIKSILIIIPFLTFLIILNKKNSHHFFLKDFLYLFTGIFITTLSVSIKPIFKGYFSEFFFYQFPANFIIEILSKTPFNYVFKEFFYDNFFFVFLCFLSIIFYKLIFKKIKDDNILKAYFLSSLIPLCMIFSPSYHHDYLMFIIPFSIIATILLSEIFIYIKYKTFFLNLIVFIFIINYVVILNKNYNLILKKENKTQLTFLRKINEENKDDLPILYFWGRLGGYSFHKHLNYFWYMDDFSQSFTEYIIGYNIYNSCLDKLNDMDKKPLIILEDEEWDKLPPKLKLIIKTNYQKDKLFPLYFYKYNKIN